MSSKTESVVTLAAVVTSLGTALGVASTDLQAATEATQYKEAPLAITQDKHLPGAKQDKWQPGAKQDKGRPGANLQKVSPGAAQYKEAPAATQIKVPAAKQIKHQPAAAVQSKDLIVK